MQPKLCECGCGQPTPLYKTDCNGNKKGEPAPFVPGHWNRGRKRDVVSTPAIDRVWDKVVERGPYDCWPWTGYSYKGAPMIHVSGTDVPVARIIYEESNGPLSEGDKVHRLCGDRACCNPAHLTTEVWTSPHGTNAKYQAGCRCSDCTAAGTKRHRAQAKANFEKRVLIDGRLVAAHLPAEKHGTSSGYRYYGCRCEPCRAKGRELNARK